MRTLSYSLVDVFTDRKFGGNQLAVFQETPALTALEMQTIARELNLSETVFVFSPGNPANQRKIRIFTPQKELPMAGHPTIGTAYVMAHENWIETVEGGNEWIFEEGVGDIKVTVHKENTIITNVEMIQPLPIFSDVFGEAQTAADLLSLSIEDIHTGYPIQSVSTGVPFLLIPIRSLAAMQRIRFRIDIWQNFFAIQEKTQHIFAFTTETEEPSSTVHSRMFAPAMGISEDPATGAASGPLGAYLLEHSVIPFIDGEKCRIRSEQGMEMGRPSFIDITITRQKGQYKEIKIGGKCVKMGTGQLIL